MAGNEDEVSQVSIESGAESDPIVADAFQILLPISAVNSIVATSRGLPFKAASTALESLVYNQWKRLPNLIPKRSETLIPQSLIVASCYVPCICSKHSPSLSITNLASHLFFKHSSSSITQQTSLPLVLVLLFLHLLNLQLHHAHIHRLLTQYLPLLSLSPPHTLGKTRSD